MSVRIKFISLAEPANIDYYILYRSSSEAGTYVDINHITHTGDGISHEYLDVSGTIDNWYKLQTHLDTGETSSLSPAFKAIALNVCNVYGTIITPQGNPISGEDVVIKIAGIETEYDDKLISKDDITVETDSDGFWSVYLLQDLRVNISIKVINDEKTFIVPSLPSVNFKTISDY